MIIPKYMIDSKTIDDEIKILNNILNQQRQLKKTLVLYLEKISDGIYNASDPTDINSLVSCLDGIKKSFSNIKENINSVIELKQFLENTLKTSGYLNTFDCETYNKTFSELFEKITDDNVFYYSFMESLLKYMDVIFNKKEET